MPEFDLSNLIAEVARSPKYAQISSVVVERIARQESQRHRKMAEAVKATRTKLHQAAGAYLSPSINYAQLGRNLDNIELSKTIDWAEQTMVLHASTAERLPHIEHFYSTCLSSLPSPNIILDLACGFNPFSFPWQSGFPHATYLACDIVLPMLRLIDQFLVKLNNNGRTFVCDLTVETPQVSADLVLLMKTIPLLDQVDRQIVPRLLSELKSDHFLVSFPSKSLGGRNKGMPKTYADRMQELLSGNNFKVSEYPFPNELAFLLSRKTHWQ